MGLSKILAAPLQTSAFAEDPLRQHQAAVQQGMRAGPSPSVELQLSPYVVLGSPEEAYQAQVRADVTYGRRPLGQMAPPVDSLSTPGYSRGSYTPVDGPDLTVTVQLGPLLWNEVSRGSPAVRLLSESA